MQRSGLRGALAAMVAVAVLGIVSVPPATPAVAQAQAACDVEAEPNDTEATARHAVGLICLSGDLPEDDPQDLVVWAPDAAGQTRTLRLTGPAGILTRLVAYEVASAPTDPLRAGRQLIELRVEPDAAGPVGIADILLPDRLLLGISRSDLPDGGRPPITDWTLEAFEGAPLPESREEEPNDAVDRATQVEGTFEIAGDLAGSDDVLTWTVPVDQPADGWRIDVRGTAGSGIRSAIRDEEGRGIASATADDSGVGSIRDLHLPHGPVAIVLAGGPTEGASPYSLVARAEDGPGDPEPNDDPARAIPLEPATPTLGRLTSLTDIDFYELPPVDPGAPRLVDVRLIWRSGLVRELCLVTLERESLQCRRGTDGVTMRDLLLPYGHFVLSVTGAPDANDRYVIRVDTTTAPATGWETEPNDGPDAANRLPGDWAIQGGGADEDQDVFAGVANGVAQLWRMDVTGEGIERAEWVRADGSTLGSAEVARDGTSARLLDLYLVPGQRQLFRVRSRSGEYRLTLAPLGPPDPDGEREPNDGSAASETLAIGTPRTGRLPTTIDVDEYRFRAAATDHLVLHVEAPSDGDVELSLVDDAGLGLSRVVEAGAILDLDLLLHAGDYGLRLRSPAKSGEDRYRVGLTRADPFVLMQDQEPNDSPAWASSLTGNGRVVGSGTAQLELDWYRLPALEVPATITITVEDGVHGVDILADAMTTLPLELSDDRLTYRSPPLAPGVEHLIRLSSMGDYGFRVDGLPSDPGPRSDDPLSIAVLDAPTEVAAFWSAGQRLEGSLSLAGPAGATVDIETVTSDRRWSATVAEPKAVLGEDGAATVPFEVTIPEDAVADVPVRISFRVRGADDAWGTAAYDVTPRRDLEPVAPYRAWSVPDALLGGLDLASPALGAVLMPSLDPVGEGLLHDGMAPSDGGLGGPIPGLPLTLAVDLAGDVPVPVAGVILNALSADPSFGGSPARFEVDLSGDAATWTTELASTLDRGIGDQAFVLPKPVDARFARLRVLSTHREGEGRISLGEWKVVGVPGVPSALEPMDLAEPMVGEYVSWASPQLGRMEVAESMLDEDLTPLEPMPAEPRERFSWAVGFFEDRAARITGIEWSDPLGSDPAVRFERLKVAIGLDGPLGPWQEVGTWDLERAPDGSVAPFVLDQPTWARFIRFTSEPMARKARVMELPGAMRIREMTTTDGYRSILGQWGLGERSGPLEAGSEAPPPIQADPDDDSQASPRSLSPGDEATGRVHHEADTDWYRVAIPDDQRTLRAVVAGEPVVGVELVLHASDGVAVPLTFGPGEVPGTAVYEAAVTAGEDYLLEVVQPPSSVVVTFDTSVSVGPYLDAILGSLRGFGRDVVKGREQVRILPFDGQPLLPGWNDEPFEIEGAAATYVLRESSSGAEANLERAARDLAPRRGARAVLIVTDAASSSYRSTAGLWRRLGEVRPLVFAVQTGGLNEAPALRRHHLLADWAASSGGVYRYASSRADIEEAFDHMASWLRRPAGYRLILETSAEELPPPEPGRISVEAPDTGTGRPGVVLAEGVAVELVLDTSGSMLEAIGPQRRIDVAKRVLVDLVSQDLPAGVPVALRAFEDEPRSCDTELAVPLGPLDPVAMAAIIREREVPDSVRTPLADAIEQVAADLATVTGPRVVVVVSDGRESCGGDPAAALENLSSSGVDVRLSIVGLGLRKKDRRAMSKLVERVGGTYFDAKGAEELAVAMASAVSAPFTLLDSAGSTVATGSIGGAPLSVPPGLYTVVVATAPEVRFDEVYVAPGATLELELPGPERP